MTEQYIFYLITALAAYLFGAVPYAFLIGKLKGVDIRTCGSGNVGATNVTRTVGALWGRLCFGLDFLKGLLPVLIVAAAAGHFSANTNYAGITAGSAAIAGHIWTVFLRFKGGKGISTSAGALLGIAWLPVVIGLVCWVIIFKLSKIVSLASIAAAVILPLSAVLLNLWAPATLKTATPELIFLTIIATAAIIKHKSNIVRLLNGTENRFDSSK